MAEEEGKSNVVLIEPNDININTTLVNGVPFVNGIPQYQDMYIFAELIAISKGRTVLEMSGEDSSSTKSIKVNLIGNNQDENTNNPNFLNFTTNYYDGSTGNRTQYESFGITNINIKINSSYVPQVNIQFVDIRGLSFFNQENSPYRILFDFPPPTFKLTIKGYYGKPITYILHLLKYTTEFQAQSGNFVIDAQLVAMTFAPLSDVLFRYIVNFPLINNNKSAEPSALIRPTNTNSLLLKLRYLYNGIKDKLGGSNTSKNYDNTLNEIKTISSTIDILKGYKTSGDLNAEGNENVFLVNKQLDSEQKEFGNDILIQVINSLDEYNERIKSESKTGIPVKMKNNGLSIVYIAATNIVEQTDDSDENVVYVGDENRKNKLIEALNKYRERLLKSTNDSRINIFSNDIGEPSTFFSDHCISPYIKKRTEYVELDITDFYLKLYKYGIENEQKKSALGIELADEINNIVANDLGMIPTIYNIFEIILNDVDEFFNILRKTSSDAETAHKKDENTLSSRFNGIDSSIYSFPLVIEKTNVYGGEKEERVAPIKLKESGIEFPELDLVQQFIDTFKDQSDIRRAFEAKYTLNDDGSYKWIPITPQDSKIGSSSPESPYPVNNGTSVNEIFKTLMKRFYMLSQGILTTDFYDTSNGSSNKAYVEYFAEGEATNIAITLTNKNVIGNLKDELNRFSNLTYFYTEYLPTLNDNNINLYNFPDNTIEDFKLTTSDNIYVNKNTNNFKGMKIYNEDVVLQEFSTDEISDSDKPIDKFIKNAKSKIIDRIFFGSESLVEFNFTDENILYIPDYKDNQSNFYNSYNMDTRFICDPLNTIKSKKTTITINNQKEIYNGGNSTLLDFVGISNYNTREISNFKNHVDIITHWVTILNLYDDSIYNIIKSTETDDDYYSQMLILSNFGYTLSPFNKYPNQLNSIVFDTPAVIETPLFFNAYVGMLLTSIKDGWDDKIVNFFTGNTIGDTSEDIKFLSTNLPNSGCFILADLHDVDNYLSNKDKETYILEYETFLFEYRNIKESLINLFEKVIEGGNTEPKYKQYDYYLYPKSGNNFSFGIKGDNFDIIKGLIGRNYIINYNQSTFKMKELDTYNTHYESIFNKNLNADFKTINDNFFNKFFTKLKEEIDKIKDNLKEEEKKQNEVKGDVDIITQTYYSFKNINDKWLTGGNNKVNGYPFNGSSGRLIDKFAFVDRAMNPIGDTIINAEALIQIFDNPDITVFTALSQLLSANGFEFFPLQNFLSFNGGEWKDCFSIYSSAISDEPSAHFVCMYIGGSSSYPSVDSNGFVNDGVLNLDNLPDFNTVLPDEPVGSINDTMVKNNNNFPWQEVRAFKVRFGEQNQSMFIDMKIDSKEYPETNESIQILSRLAGDEKNNAPTPKGQNLYNLYENRAYGATITSLGNATIQPTQYFQIENVPLFNGAYIILNVEHNIVPNKMTTTFSGTKILKYPVPRVTNPFAFTGFNGEFSSMSSGELVRGAILTEYNKTKINAIYNLTIK